MEAKFKTIEVNCFEEATLAALYTKVRPLLSVNYSTALDLRKWLKALSEEVEHTLAVEKEIMLKENVAEERAKLYDVKKTMEALEVPKAVLELIDVPAHAFDLLERHNLITEMSDA